MPTPNPNENRDTFISRCIPVVMNDGTARTPEQAYAVCESIYQRSKNEYNRKTELTDQPESENKI